MKRLLPALVLAAVIPLAVMALDVDREELESQITRTVEFRNYQGPYERVDTIEAIRGIGIALAGGARGPGEVVDYFGRYRIIHAVDPDVSQGLDADILVVLEGARVDHIDNIRRILSAYLEEAYHYSRADAWLISEFVTIYNAIHRGDLEFFASRYKPIVIDNVDDRNVGISTLYSDWPGRTQLVTPLRSAAAPEAIGAIDALALIDDGVVDELRTRPDMALEQRRDMIDLVERGIEEDEERVEREETAIAAERERIEHERELIERQREAIADAVERERIDPDEAQRREAELAEQTREMVEREEALSQREEAAEREREEIARRIEETRERREEIAEDTRTVMERAPVALLREDREVLFLETRMRAGRASGRRLVIPLGQLLIIDGATATVLRRSETDAVTNRTIERWANDHLVIAEYDGEARLMRINPVSLATVMVGSAEMFPESMVVPRPDRGEIFAVVRDGGGWHLGKFNSNLALLERSLIQVEPFTHITVAQDVVYVQRADGIVVGLALVDLTQ